MYILKHTQIIKQQPTIMNSSVFKYKHHYQHQQYQHFNRRSNNKNQNSNSNGNNCGISSHNNNNQNSIFILNTATNNILPNSHHNVASSSASASNSAAPSSVWSSASSTMCSPAAHALQKLFNCSSSSFKFNHGCSSGIESKTFKSKSEILKKKSKFWKYLEDEDNDKNNQKGIDDAEENDQKLLAKGLKFKSSNGSRSFESDNYNQDDLCELLEYSCSLCDNCRCVDCQIGYFDCENSDDSNSEYSFHLSAYEEDEEADNSDDDNVLERRMALKSSGVVDNCLQAQKLEVDFEIPSDCCAACCIDEQLNCSKSECCQQCFLREMHAAGKDETTHPNFVTTKDH